MPKENDKQIKVKDLTKMTLDKWKGNKTYDAFITEMLTYFEITGINPGSKIATPLVAVESQATRVIQVVRGIEKDQSVYLKSILDHVKRLSGSPVAPEVPAGFNPDEYIHINKVQELTGEMDKITQENAQSKGEIRKLQTELEIERKKAPEGSGQVNTKVILEILDILDEKKQTSTFDLDSYRIDKSTFDKYIARLKSELKK